MKLNKLTSAVSVSLLAVALTACGGSDNSGDEGPILTPSPAVTPAPTPSVTPTPTPAAGSTAAELTAALTAAGLTNANAAALIAANPGLTVGSAEYNTLLAQKLSEQNKNTGSATDPISVTVDKQNPYIPSVGDTNKTATVTANQYSRQTGSNFDRSANPTQLGGLGAVGTDDPTKQNPYLSNYVLGVEVVGGKIVAIDSTGELVVKNGSANSGKVVAAASSPYVGNGSTTTGLRYTASTSDRGDRPFMYASTANPPSTGEQYNLTAANHQAAASTAPLDVGSGKTGATQGSRVGAGFSEATAGTSTGTIYTLQDFNVSNVQVSLTDAEAAVTEAIKVNSTLGRDADGVVSDYDGVTSGLLVYNAKSIPVGNSDGAKLGYMVPVFGVEENIYDADGNALNAVESLQAATGTSFDANTSRTALFLAKETVQYKGVNDTDNKTYYLEKYRGATDKEYSAPNSGVGGVDAVLQAGGDKIFSDNEVKHFANNVANALETRIFGKNYNSYERGVEGVQNNPNTYMARYDSKNQLTAAGVSVRTLSEVQYGRLTNNIDVLADKTASSPKSIVYRQFQQHGADNSVDTYFYRGTNHTTIDQMKDLVAKGGTYQYYGHALTYGVGPIVQKTATNTLPTAFGNTSTTSTIGNFVQAKYDVAKAKLDGSVYNFINEKVNDKTTNKDFIKQDLIKFTGDVYGNTVIGTASKEGTTETGTLTASFFGPSANELGGSISSISRSEGYAQPKWGAVFGATKGSAVENFNVIEQGQ